MQRRLRQHLMEISWGGVAPAIADYASSGARIHVSAKAFRNLCRCVPEPPGKKASSNRATGTLPNGNFYEKVRLCSRAVAGSIFVDTLDTGGVEVPPLLQVVSRCACVFCKNELLRQGWDSAIRTMCEVHATAPIDGCSNCSVVCKQALRFDNLYLCRSVGGGDVFLEGGGVERYELSRSSTGLACFWIKKTGS